jgi:hypothetical protein
MYPDPLEHRWTWRIDRDRSWAPEVRATINGVMRELNRHALDGPADTGR